MQNEEIILKKLIKNPYIKQTELVKLLKISQRSISRSIKELKNQNKIQRIGSDKNGYWKILKDS